MDPTLGRVAMSATMSIDSRPGSRMTRSATARAGTSAGSADRLRFSDNPRSRPPRGRGATNAGRRAATLLLRADVAELVDAHGSGPCGGNPVEVQVLSSA